MKKIRWLFLIVVSVMCANDLEFMYSLKDAKVQAQQEQKAILVMLTQEGCPACEYMKEVVFEDEILASYMRSYFVLVELDINKDVVPKELKVFGTPTFYVLNYQGEKIGRQMVGGAQAPAFLDVLKEYKKRL